MADIGQIDYLGSRCPSRPSLSLPTRTRTRLYRIRIFLHALQARPTPPWVPSDTPGKSARLLRFLPNDEGFVELLRVEPLHRHSGEIHAYNIGGSRQLCTGEVIGPGDYVYEPAGNADWWRVVGDETLVALAVVRGTVELLARTAAFARLPTRPRSA